MCVILYKVSTACSCHPTLSLRVQWCALRQQSADQCLRLYCPAHCIHCWCPLHCCVLLSRAYCMLRLSISLSSVVVCLPCSWAGCTTCTAMFCSTDLCHRRVVWLSCCRRLCLAELHVHASMDGQGALSCLLHQCLKTGALNQFTKHKDGVGVTRVLSLSETVLAPFIVLHGR